MFRHAFRRLYGFAPPRPLAVVSVSAATFAFVKSPRPVLAQSPNSPHRIILDTDPGVDDALAFMLALGSTDKIRIEGISITRGNGGNMRELGANAKLLLRLGGLEGKPVSLGAPGHGDKENAMCTADGKPLITVHGHDTLGNVSAKYGRSDADFTGFHPLAAPEYIYDACSRAPGEISLVCIGPLTNVAAALELHPDLPELVREVVIMGGAFGERRGNRTPCAEANFEDDPEAAQAVFQANFRKVVVAGLDVTHQTDVDVLRKACSGLNSTVSQFVWDVCEPYMAFYRYVGQSVAPAHDVVPVMYLVRPDLFESKHVRVEVETKGEFTRGMSLADWKGQWGKRPNCHVLISILNTAAFTQEFAEAVARLPLKDPLAQN